MTTSASAPAKSASVRPSTSAPAAVVRRNNERSKRDLFSGEVELSAKVVERDNVSPFTAARNENSVLFSLDQLSKPPVRASESLMPRANVSASGNGAAPTKKEDSGLIDLNKMLMNDEKLSAKSVRPSPISEAPLGYAREVAHTPVPTVLDGNPFAANKKKNKGAFVMGGIAAVAAVVAIGVVATNREDARVREAAAAAAAPPAPPPAAPVVEAPPAPVAPAPIAANAPSTSEEKPAARSTGRAGKAKGKASSRVSSGAASVPAAPPPPKKAADPCGCHGDLLCNMKCSAKK